MTFSFSFAIRFLLFLFFLSPSFNFSPDLPRLDLRTRRHCQRGAVMASFPTAIANQRAAMLASFRAPISSSVARRRRRAALPVAHKNFTGSVGGEVELKCRVQFPGDGKWIPYTFKWTKLGAKKPLFFRFPGYPPHLEAPYVNRVEMTIPASIRMKELRPEDEGWYHCLITYMNRVPEDMPSPNGTWVHLSILSKPVFSKTSASTLILKEGAPMRLQCLADGTPPPKIFWHRDGFPLTTDDRVLVDDDQLRIEAVRRKDAGVYVCRAHNEVGEVTHSMKVVLQGGVFILSPPMNTTVNEGLRTQLTCKAEARPSNISYRWSRDGVDVAEHPSLGPRTTALEDGSLAISSVFGDDSGWFLCTASNGLSSATAKAFLNVTYAPKLLRMPERLYLPKGAAAEIPCRVDANPPVMEVHWTKDDQPLREIRSSSSSSSFSSSHLTKDLRSFGFSAAPSAPSAASAAAAAAAAKSKRTSNLSSFSFELLRSGLVISLSSADPDHEGVYSCRPINSVGASPASPPVAVLVRDPPRFLRRPIKYVQRMLGDSASFSCAADGDPEPTIRWRKRSHESFRGGGVPSASTASLPASPRIVQSRGNLTILNLVLRDAGDYECLASNVVTTVGAVARLIIETTTPHAPYNLTVNTGHFSATVAWQPAFNAGLAMQYVLWFKRLGRDKMDWKTVRIHPDDAVSFSIEDLLPDSVYEFSVQAKTSSGDGMFSKVIRIRTKSLDDDDDDVNRTRATGEAAPLTTDDAAAPLLSRPAPAHSIRLSPLAGRNGLNISWSTPLNSSLPISFYIVEYRSEDSTGQRDDHLSSSSSSTPPPWSALTDRVVDALWTTIRDLRPGFRYDFRVFSFSASKTFSAASETASYVAPPTAPLAGGIVVSTATVAGVAGGAAFLLVTATLSVAATQVVKRRRREEAAKREREKKKFPAVKYTEARASNGQLRAVTVERLNGVGV